METTRDYCSALFHLATVIQTSIKKLIQSNKKTPMGVVNTVHWICE